MDRYQCFSCLPFHKRGFIKITNSPSSGGLLDGGSNSSVLLKKKLILYILHIHMERAKTTFDFNHLDKNIDKNK